MGKESEDFNSSVEKFNLDYLVSTDFVLKLRSTYLTYSVWGTNDVCLSVRTREVGTAKIGLILRDTLTSKYRPSSKILGFGLHGL